VIPRVLLRAHLLKSIGPGQRYLMEREWLSDHRVMQRTNEGTPEASRDWKQIGRWLDIGKERVAVTAQGWVIDPD
jgi:hypothetical protein